MRQPPLQLDSSSARPRKWLPGSRLTVVCATVAALLAGAAHAGDILRGGATTTSARENSAARNNSGAEAAAAARTRAQDRLSRTTKAVADMRQLQEAARAAAAATDPGIPDGLVINGLDRYQPGEANFRWDGASAPVQTGNDVTITQNLQQAILHWKTFNVGKNTQVNFDQSAGGADSGKWIAFNKVMGSVAPSQIRGKINADGQVYIINQSGIIFGAGSQVNTRTLVASSLPINDNLITRGLLNQTAGQAEFLFTSTGQNGFTPPAATTPTGQTGNIIVEKGAEITAQVNSEGSGGRVMLVGANVSNQGILGAPSGQVILAAGLQIGANAHNSLEPSLRGLDIFVGDVGSYAGTVSNAGLVSIPTGNLIMAGKQVEQMGIIDSTTSVTLNGRVDLRASYNAIPAADFNPTAPSGVPAFLETSTGNVILGENSVVRILPDYASTATAVATKLPLNSEVSILGSSVFFGKNSVMQAPSGVVGIRAGSWGAVNLVTTDGIVRSRRAANEFVYTGGFVQLDSGAVIDVSGSTDVLNPLADSILSVQLRGSELAVAPVQRTGVLRGITIEIDVRRSGSFDGRQWVGTPLGDASGFLDVVKKNVAQLTATGGSVTIEAGGGFVAQNGSVIDVSGGYFRNEGGKVQTTRVLYQGRHLIDVASATPDRIYDGIYEPQSTQVHAKWGVTKTFQNSLAPTGAYMENEYLSGADGGALSITAPAMILDGTLLGATLSGPRQIRQTETSSEVPISSSLELRFESQIQLPTVGVAYADFSPTPPVITFGPQKDVTPVSALTSGTAAGATIPRDRLAALDFPSDFYQISGFGEVNVINDDGQFLIPEGVTVQLPAEGVLTATGRQISIMGEVRAPGGRIEFQAANLSAYETAVRSRLVPNFPQPDVDLAQGSITLGPGAKLDVAGLVIDDRSTGPLDSAPTGLFTNGGSVALRGFNISLAQGSIIDVSGGVAVTARGKYSYGDAGSIAIEAGKDVNYASVLGGRLDLGGNLRGFAGREATGGTLSIQAPLIQVGGTPLDSDTLLLQPSFFSEGGFQEFQLTGIGKPILGWKPDPADPDAPVPYLPAVYFAEGTIVKPIAKSLVYSSSPANRGRDLLVETSRPPGERSPISVSVSAGVIRNQFFDPSMNENAGRLVVTRGDVLIGEGSRLEVESGGNIALTGATVSVLGSLIAPGGDIQISGSNSFPQNTSIEVLAQTALPTVYIGATALVSTVGAAVLEPDSFGRRVGTLLDGGTISIGGNIVAEAGAVLDVSGASQVFDVSRARIGLTPSNVPRSTSGLTTKPLVRETIAYQADSNAGTIQFVGSQMLYSDATLKGEAGGSQAAGGTLVVSSGRFYPADSDELRLSSDTNMIVTQNKLALRGISRRGIGRVLRDESGLAISGGGYFAADQFHQGGFESLDLNYYFKENATPVPVGGNIAFEGDVTITARGSLRVAGGGVIRAQGRVSLKASYVALGQPFRAPLEEGEEFIAFRAFDPQTGESPRELVQPTFGSGSIQVEGELVDVGTTVLRGIGAATVRAPSGEIRGSGTLSIAGDLALDAAQVYPVTLAGFDLFAYDHAGGLGSVTITRSGLGFSPLSAGGALRVFASKIYQGGVLVAPFGSIVLGWDGTDFDLSTAAIDSPVNAIVGNALTVPTTRQVNLAPGSITSVSGLDYSSGRELTVPLGLSLDGVSLYDSRGTNVTAQNLKEKTIHVAGDQVNFESGAVIDLRGGGDLLAYRWVPGTGGPIDILGEPSASWASGSTYDSGDLVIYQGKTYSARTSIDPDDFSGGLAPTPAVNRYWTQVAESFAILPGYQSRHMPYAPFNTLTSADTLGNDPGYVSRALQVGDQLFLDETPSLKAGSYTLLPQRYALLPGAFLVTPIGSDTPGVSVSGDPSNFTTSRPFVHSTQSDGSSNVTGFRFNSYRLASSISPLRSLFEVTSPDVYLRRAEYEVYAVSEFAREASSRLGLAETQRLPADSGYLLFSANQAMRLAGTVLSPPSGVGRGSRIDISSAADIYIIGSGQSDGGPVSLNADTISRFGAESLVIGGIRRNSGSGSTIEVRTSNILMNNSGTPLSGIDVGLVAKRTLVFQTGSMLQATGTSSEPAQSYALPGDGVAARVSADPSALILRTNVTANPAPRLTVGSGASISGASVVLDSSYGFELNTTAKLGGQSFTFGAGQIGLLLAGDTEPTGQVDLANPQLQLGREVLDQLQQSRSVRLKTYQKSIDIYGPGQFGSGALDLLSMETGEIRGFNQGNGAATLSAASISLGNPRGLAAVGAIRPGSGSLVWNTSTTRIGEGQITVSQYRNVSFYSPEGVIFSGVGGMTSDSDISISTSLITGSNGAKHSIVAGGTLALFQSPSASSVVGGLGANLLFKGSSVLALSNISLPSGKIELRAIGVGGSVIVGGHLDAQGSSRAFFDQTRYSDAGEILVVAEHGNVSLLPGGSISVGANPAGGSAGIIDIRAPEGQFSSAGILSGAGSTTGNGADFRLDTLQLASLDVLQTTLSAGGITESWDIRVRTGDLLVAGTSSVRRFQLSADIGSITVAGTIGRRDITGGEIRLVAGADLTIRPGALLTVAATQFNSAGKGGAIYLEAGAPTTTGLGSGILDIQLGSRIDLSVAAFIPGDFQTTYFQPDGSRIASSAFRGQFEGTLHLRAPQVTANTDLGINKIQGTIVGASSILAEGSRVYDRTAVGGVMNIALRDSINIDGAAFVNAFEALNSTKLLGGTVNAGLESILVVAPGAEVINRAGDLILGTANTAAGNTSNEATYLADWDLSSFRFGAKRAPGVLTLRARDDIIVNNTLSDGFNPIATGSAAEFADRGHSRMWLGTLQSIESQRPVNLQSWSFRLTAGSDLSAADSRRTLATGDLSPGKGSLLVGEFYPAVPNTLSGSQGTNQGIGISGQTADTIRILVTSNPLPSATRGTRFEVIRTGTGSIDINAGLDIQLRNQFSTVYTAGVAPPDLTRIFVPGDFVLPRTDLSAAQHPNQSNLGAIQQRYGPTYALSGGDIALAAGRNIGRYTSAFSGLTPTGPAIQDVGRQIPSNWLYWRGYVDDTGTFGEQGVNNATRDASGSTTWWIDYSNFFQGFGALGGGDLSMVSGGDLINADAVIPTNARMAGVDPSSGLNLRPDSSNLQELGGGDLSIRAGGNIVGGSYYVQRGSGEVFAAGDIATNSTRSMSRGALVTSGNPIAPSDSQTWLPTIFYVGNSFFDVTARGSILTGPVSHPFFLPPGLNNKFWYKSRFYTLSADAGASFSAYGGSIVHRNEVSNTAGQPAPILLTWINSHNLRTNTTSANFQPWLRLAEISADPYSTILSVSAPRLISTSFGGDIQLNGDLTLFPSWGGDLQLYSAGGISGLQDLGQAFHPETNASVRAYSSAEINVSDADPSKLPSAITPVAFQSLVGRVLSDLRDQRDPQESVEAAFAETGSIVGDAASIAVQRPLHADPLLHLASVNPVRVYATGGDLTGLTVFSPKLSWIMAERDITDVAFYLQNTTSSSISIVSAGRDIIAFNENSPAQVRSDDSGLGNYNFDTKIERAAGEPTGALSGDIQISGPGTLEVLAGRDIDLGTGANLIDGRGVGITSIGRLRNPVLPPEGASLVVFSGVKAPVGGPAIGLSGSDIRFPEFIRAFLPDGIVGSDFITTGLGERLARFKDLSLEEQNLAALDVFFSLLKVSVTEAAASGDYGIGVEAANALFGASRSVGDIFTRARNIRTVSGGSITLGTPGGGITMASDIFGNPLTPPGIVTDKGGEVSIFMDQSLDIGQARVFTLRGGDLTIWSSHGNIAAGTASKNLVSAPPTRVSVDSTSGEVVTDLGGLATGGGIGVLASVEGVEPSQIYLGVPEGTLDAGDAGIRATGDITIAAAAVANADNIAAGGISVGVPSAPVAAAPNIGGLTSGSTATGAASAAANQVAGQSRSQPSDEVEAPSIISVEVLGYGGDDDLGE